MSSSSAPSLENNATRSDSVYSAPMSSSSAPPAACSPAKSVLNLPPGYHFLPTDHELVVHYLRPRLAGNRRLPLPIFFYERILNYHPDKLIEKYRQYGEGRWFFFTARELKHSGGNRPNRTTPDNGHWNATGSIRPIRSAGGVLVGCRRTLVFYEASRSRSRKKKNQAGLLPAAAEEEQEGDGGQAAKAKDGVKTEWTMYEYESLASEAEFEAILTGNAKTDVMVLCTIQKKKRHQEGGETKKKSTRQRKTKEEVLEQEAVPAATGDVNVEHGSRAATTEGQDEDHVQRAVMEAAAEPLPELAYHDAAPAGVGSFSVDPDQMNMPYYYLTNSLSSSVPTHSQETTLMAPAGGDNHTVMHQQQNYYFINHSTNMENSQSFHVQETPPQEFLPCSGTKMAAPLGGGNVVDHHHVLQNKTVNMTPAAEAHTSDGYGPGLSNSSYGHGGGDCDHLSTIMGHPEPPRFSFQSQGPLLNNQVSLNHQNSAASMLVGYDQRNGVGLAPKIV